MEDELLAKMRRRIEVGVACEEDLLFLLVKMRKLLERKKLEEDFPVLLFYCDWSVHATMDRQRAKQMLQLVDELIDRHRNGNTDALRETALLLSLAGLRVEIAKFCKKFDLPLYLISDEDAWDRFRRFFVENISDCALILKRPFRHVRGLSFIGSAAAEVGEDGVCVRIELTDSPALELQVW